MITPDTLFTGKNCIHFDEIHSTNVYASELISKTSPSEGTCIITDFQTAGRGQIGRYWHSERGKNLLISYIYYPVKLKVDDQFLLNIISGLAVYDVVAHYTNNVTIKWPNDIYVADKKIAGILVQNTLRADRIKSTIIGIGLNVNETEFPSELPNPTSLSLCTNESLKIDEIYSTLSKRLEFHYLKMKSGHYSELITNYHKLLYKMDIISSFLDKDGLYIQGYIRSVNREGNLVIETLKGETRSFAFRELKFI